MTPGTLISNRRWRREAAFRSSGPSALIRRFEKLAAAMASRKNPVVKALYEVSRMIRQQAPDDMSRDLGIIANGQLALHYWIAAFGTMRAYASKLGMDRTASAMESCLKEAKEADEQHNGLAQRIMGA